jgi:ABC-2 type transport system ATP-binding protein
MPPTSGTAVVAGYDVFNQNMEVRNRVGYLPENVPLYRDMTARGYLKYVAEIRGVPDRGKKADEALARVGMLQRADSRIRALSKGMRQRIGVAQALIHDPEVLILDEPTIGLDPLQVLELRQLVTELGRDHTVLFSTHILSEAEQVCDNVVIINRGEIVAEGSPTTLRAQLERGGRVLVRVEAPPDEVMTALGALPGVADVETGLDSIVVTPASPDGDPRPQIAQAIVNQGWNLIELRALAVNLEEIFLELTHQTEQIEPGSTEAVESEVAQ